MKRIAHISDLHFGRINEIVVKALLVDLERLAPDFIVVSGDLTQRGRRHEFSAARTFLDRLPARYLVIPGNHDIPGFNNLMARVTGPLDRYRQYISNELDPLYIDDDMVVLGLNTARSFGPHWSWEHGRLSERQIARIRSVFRDVPAAKFKIVVTHHPFLPPPDAPSTRMVGRAKQALVALESCQIDLLLAGHLHRSFTGDITSHYLAVKRSILVVQASTATSTRLRDDPNAYNVICLGSDAVTIYARVWDGTGFEEHQVARFIRRADKWLPDQEAA